MGLMMEVGKDDGDDGDEGLELFLADAGRVVCFSGDLHDEDEVEEVDGDGTSSGGNTGGGGDSRRLRAHSGSS